MPTSCLTSGKVSGKPGCIVQDLEAHFYSLRGLDLVQNLKKQV